MQRHTPLLFLLTLATALRAAAGTDAPPLNDIDYRLETTGEAGAPLCRLDVKRPRKGQGFKTVVWLHGGGLTKGRRAFVRLDESIAQVAVGYRLLGQDGLTDGEACIDDAAAAVAWTLKHIGDCGGDTNQVYLSGMSAGGYLAMMVGMAPKYLAKYGFRPTDLAGVVAISGQATKHFAVRKFAGDDDPAFRPKIDALAPLAWVGKDLPPLLCVCGQPPYEWKGRSEENRLLIASCRALGHPSATFVELPLCDHGRAYTAGLPYLELFILGRLPR